MRLSASKGLLWTALLACVVSLVQAPSARCASLEQDLRSEAQVIASFGSRMSGSEGCRATEEYLAEQFRLAGLQRITRQEFPLTVPVDRGGVLRVGDEEFPVYGLWPNLVRTPTTPEEGIRGPLVYAGTGELREFNGKRLENAVVVLDFNCQTNWLNAPLLGARAVVFLEPPVTSRGEAEKKFLQVPVDVPRFWLAREHVQRVRQLAEQGASALLRARMDWEEAWVRNVIGFLPGSDPELSKECIVIQAYYDATSVAPGVAPGADASSGLLAFLQLMRSLAEESRKRSVLFVATPGHWQALQGMLQFAQVFGEKGRRPSEDRRNRQQADKRIVKQVGEWKRRAEDLRASLARTLDNEEQRQMRTALAGLDRVAANAEVNRRLLSEYSEYHFPLFISLDLSSQSRRLGMFFCGWYYEDADLIRFFSPLGRTFGEYAEQFASARGLKKDDVYVDGANPVQQLSWQDFFAGKIAFDSEMTIRSGRPGITFATVDDARQLFNTPLDRPDKVHFGNLAAQVSLLDFSLKRFLNHSDLTNTAFKRTHRLKLVDYLFARKIGGVVLEFQRRKSFLPNTPVPDALVLVQAKYKTMMGVNPTRVQFADERGVFEMMGQVDTRPYIFYPIVEAYNVDPATGAITYAPDRGPEGDTKYPRDVAGRERTRRPVIVFPCAPIDLYDVLDQRYFQTLQQVFVYDARTGGEPVSWGSSQPSFAGAAEMPSAVEPSAVVYAMPGSRVKITMAMGLLGVRMVLINANEEHPEGRGFDALETPRIVLTPLRAVEDMNVLDEYRLRELWKRGITNARVDLAHRTASAALGQAKEDLARRDYESAMRHTRQAWGYESSGYPDVLGTSKDVVKGVVFYLAMLLPFCYFAERLLFGFGDVKRRIAATLAIFFAVFLVLRAVHPAFQLATNGAIILLAFVILTLAIVVIAIVASKFNEQLERLKQEITGVHRADVGRVSAAGVAFALGVANMRRRKTRTALTSVTLILLTFTVLSFTSVQSYMKANRLAIRGQPTYNGVLVRDKVWSSLEEPTYPVLRTELTDAVVVSPRAWVASLDLLRPANLQIVGPAEKRYTVNVALGLSPQEPRVAGLDKVLIAGRWFKEDERNACILPSSIAEALGIRQQEVGRAVVRLRGMPLRVVGIVGDKELEAFRDVDGESILPVDYSHLPAEQIQQIQEQSSNRFRLGRAGVQGLLQEYVHYGSNLAIIIPYDTAINSSEGTLRSVAVRFPEAHNVRATVEKLMQRYALNMYAAVGQRLYLYSSMAMTSLRGVQSLFVPVLIAALIVLNTMLGAVYERTKEIGILSAVGLAPVHVGALFLAEACVYANIGAIGGYLIGQTLSQFMVRYGVLAGLSLNYSSTAAVAMAVAVVLTVLASTLYPARKAASMAVPDIERRWRLPEPEGEWIRLKMPFTVSHDDGRAVMMFLVEFFDAYVGYSGGEFYAEPAGFERVETGRGDGYAVEVRMWLAPYDLGVSQMVRLESRPTAEGTVYEISLAVQRVSGDMSSWKKTNWFFLNTLRKQFLIWRTITPEQRKEYAARADRRLAEGVTVTS